MWSDCSNKKSEAFMVHFSSCCNLWRLSYGSFIMKYSIENNTLMQSRTWSAKLKIFEILCWSTSYTQSSSSVSKTVDTVNYCDIFHLNGCNAFSPIEWMQLVRRSNPLIRNHSELRSELCTPYPGLMFYFARYSYKDTVIDCQAQKESIMIGIIILLTPAPFPAWKPPIILIP